MSYQVRCRPSSGCDDTTFKRNVMAKLVGGDFEIFLKRTTMMKVVILVPKHQALEICRLIFMVCMVVPCISNIKSFYLSQLMHINYFNC
jgi:hypothetical protein